MVGVLLRVVLDMTKPARPFSKPLAALYITCSSTLHATSRQSMEREASVASDESGEYEPVDGDKKPRLPATRRR